MKRKVLSLLLVAVIGMGSVPMNVQASEVTEAAAESVEDADVASGGSEVENDSEEANELEENSDVVVPEENTVVEPENDENSAESNQTVTWTIDDSDWLHFVSDDAEDESEDIQEEAVEEEPEEVPDQYKSYMAYDGYSYHDGHLYYKGLQLDENGMYEVTDEDGTVWYYDPMDPEFDDYYVDQVDDSALLSSKVMMRSTRSNTGYYTGPMDGVTYAYPSAVNGQEVICGVDVSYHQKDINWQGLRDSGVEFAILRAGYRSLGDGSLHEDPMFRTYIQQAYAAGIKIGVYFFSQACGTDEAIQEANLCRDIISGYRDMISLPVFMDYEYSGDNSRLYKQHVAEINAGLDTCAIHTNVINSFCGTMSSAGFLSGVYANRTMLNTQLHVEGIPSNYYIWLANYNTSTPYAKRLNCWQYRSDFTGFNAYIGSASIDCDFWFGDLPGAKYMYNGTNFAPVFNARYYYNMNPDLQSAFGYDESALLNHFINFGLYEGRLGSDSFNVNAYRFNNDDLYSVYGDDLMGYCMHYIYYGQYENRNATTYSNCYAGVFDVNYYYNRYPDLQAAYGYNPAKLIDHFWRWGLAEGRRGNATFNVYAYRDNYSDLQAAFGDNLKAYCIHYLQNGKAEGRNPSVFLKYADIFDLNYYMSHNPDVGAAFGENSYAILRHFLTYGMREGRQGCATFNVFNYRNRYADLRNAFGDDLPSYYYHYLNYGRYEGRNGR